MSSAWYPVITVVGNALVTAVALLLNTSLLRRQRPKDELRAERRRVYADYLAQASLVLYEFGPIGAVNASVESAVTPHLVRRRKRKRNEDEAFSAIDTMMRDLRTMYAGILTVASNDVLRIATEFNQGLLERLTAQIVRLAKGPIDDQLLDLDVAHQQLAVLTGAMRAEVGVTERRWFWEQQGPPQEGP